MSCCFPAVATLSKWPAAAVPARPRPVPSICGMSSCSTSGRLLPPRPHVGSTALRPRLPTACNGRLQQRPRLRPAASSSSHNSSSGGSGSNDGGSSTGGPLDSVDGNAAEVASPPPTTAAAFSGSGIKYGSSCDGDDTDANMKRVLQQQQQPPSALQEASQVAQQVQQQASHAVQQVQQEASQVVQQVQQQASQVAQQVQQEASHAVQQVQQQQQASPVFPFVSREYLERVDGVHRPIGLVLFSAYVLQTAVDLTGIDPSGTLLPAMVGGSLGVLFAVLHRWGVARWWAPPRRPLRVVITGSSKGIGKALAREFLRSGDSVVITSRSADGVGAAVEQLRKEAGGGVPVAGGGVPGQSPRPSSLPPRIGNDDVSVVGTPGMAMRVTEGEGDIPEVAMKVTGDGVGIPEMAMKATEGEADVAAEAAARVYGADCDDASDVGSPEMAFKGTEGEAEAPRVYGIDCDVSSGESVARLAEFAVSSMGGVDVWINNAGYSGSFKSFVDLSPEQLQRIVSTNLGGAVLCTQAAIRLMAQQPEGGHVFCMDGAGADGMPTPMYAAYGATKAGVAHLMRSVQREVAEAAQQQAQQGQRQGQGRHEVAEAAHQQAQQGQGQGLQREEREEEEEGGTRLNGARGAATGVVRKRRKGADARRRRAAANSGGMARVGVHTLSPGMVLTDLLLEGATIRNLQVFNVLCEQPETVAAYLAPRVRTVAARRLPSTYIRYLTTPRALGKFLTAPGRMGRFFDEEGNAVYPPDEQDRLFGAGHSRRTRRLAEAAASRSRRLALAYSLAIATSYLLLITSIVGSGGANAAG